MKYLRILIALLLIPVAIGLSVSLFEILINLGKNVSQQAVPFWVGAGSYFLFQLIFFKPIRTYVFGHELTHALAGLLSGARLKKFKVSASGGSVELTKTNIFITLAPYFIPIYTVILTAVYWAGSRFWPLENYHSVFLFLAGFTLAFHFGLTHFALMQGQSDLKHFGVFFSSVMIVIVNCVVLAALFKVFFMSEVGLKNYFAESWEKTCAVTDYSIDTGKKICSNFQSMK
jgi:hypothetical protein